MNTQKTAILLTFHGTILILCSGLHIWNELHLTLASGGAILGGLFVIAVAYFMNRRAGWSFYAGLGLLFLLILFLGWQSTESFYQLVDKIQNDNLGNPYPQSNSFLLLFTMFTLSVIVEGIQLMLTRSNANEVN